MTVRVGLRRGAENRDALVIVAHLLGELRDALSLEHLCAHCGATDHGVPLLLIRGEYAAQRISISRTPHWLAVALTDGENPLQRVGVDVETLKRVARHDVAAIAFAPAEAAAFAAMKPNEQAPAATQLWTAKEAVTKMQGVGLRADLSAYECSVVGPVIDECSVLFPEGQASVTFYSPHSGVLAAVATSVPEAVVWLSWGRA
jgi:phosphopantetheinyl transferase